MTEDYQEMKEATNSISNMIIKFLRGRFRSESVFPERTDPDQKPCY